MKVDNAIAAKFAGLVVDCWNNPQLHQLYDSDPVGVLAARGIQLPLGVATPVIPAQPKFNLGASWKDMPFENWNVQVTPLTAANAGSKVAAVSVSSLACIACPVSCFSSLSNA